MKPSKEGPVKTILYWIIAENNEKIQNILVDQKCWIINGESWGDVGISIANSNKSIKLPAWSNFENIKCRDFADAMCLFLEACEMEYELQYVGVYGYLLTAEQDLGFLKLLIARGKLK
jgi:hypothetical protein